jgi:translation initiation factor IF-2
LVQGGTLKVGDYLLAGKNHGKVKAMLDEREDS